MTDIPLDAITTVLIFLIGVPTLVIQSLPTAVRRVVLRRRRWLFVSTAAPVLIALMAIVWGIWEHEYPSAGQTLDASFSFFRNLKTMLAGAYGLNGHWIVVFVCLLSTVVLAAFFTLSYGRSEQIINHLAWRAKHTTHWRKTNARLDARTLEELIEIGQQADSGEDKQLALHALKTLIHHVVRHPQYRGDALEDLIQGVVKVVDSRSQPGHPQIFRSAIETLREVVDRDYTVAHQYNDIDVMRAIHALSAVARAALYEISPSSETETTLMYCVETLDWTHDVHPQVVTEVSQALFEVGAACLAKKQVLPAARASAALVSLVSEQRPAGGELAADTLGLIANFWHNGGAARVYAHQTLTQLAADLTQPLPKALAEAHQHYVMRTEFQTADHLRGLLDELDAPHKPQTA